MIAARSSRSPSLSSSAVQLVPLVQLATAPGAAPVSRRRARCVHLPIAANLRIDAVVRGLPAWIVAVPRAGLEKPTRLFQHLKTFLHLFGGFQPGQAPVPPNDSCIVGAFPLFSAAPGALGP